MLCDTKSYYPDKVDSMIFFQDNNVEKAEIMDCYNSLISQGKYEEADDYINRQEGIYGYFADFFNALENRIFNLQDYLINKPPKKQPFVYYSELQNDIATELHIFSDLDIEEDIESIALFSENDERYEFFDDSYLLTIDEEEEPPEQLLLGSDTIWI